MNNTIFTSVALLLVLCHVGCSKENDKAEISYQLRTINRFSTVGRAFPDGPLDLYGRTNGTITWSAGFANVTSIAFEAEGGSGSIAFQSDEAKLVNLFEPVINIGRIGVKPGNYEDADFEIELKGHPGHPALELRGMYNGSTIIFRVEENYEIEGEMQQVEIHQDGDHLSLTSLDLSLLASGIAGADLDTANRDTSGNIIISSTSNTALYQILLDNLQDLEEEDFQ